MSNPTPPAGWYPSPGEVGIERRWTGTAWSAERREASVDLRMVGSVPNVGLRPGQVMLLLFGGIFALLVLVGLLFPLMVFRSN